MHRDARSGIAVGLCLLGSLAFGNTVDDDSKSRKKEITWTKSYDDAVAQARKTKKPIMVDLYANWFEPSKQLEKNTLSDPMVIKLADTKFVPLKLEIDHEGKKAAAKYEVATPTILFLDPNNLTKLDERPAAGEVAGKLEGYQPPELFAMNLLRIESNYREFPTLVDTIKADPKNVKALGKLVVIYHERENDQKAIELLSKAEELDPKNSKDLLTKAYNAVADYYQEEAFLVIQKGDVKARDELLSKAVSLFLKAVKTGRDAEDVYYGESNIAKCHVMQSKLREGAVELEEALKIPGISAANKEQAALMLGQLKELIKQSQTKKPEDK
jgi:tetratricopeptide (TPR) repeat protein